MKRLSDAIKARFVRRKPGSAEKMMFDSYMVIYNGLMGFNGDLMGFNGGLMGFNGI